MANMPIMVEEVNRARKLLRRKEGISRREIATRLKITTRRAAQLIARAKARVLRVVGRTTLYRGR